MQYSILSLDGGGSWALLQAMALKNLYPDHSTSEVLNAFDLVVANSGGSLMMAAMLEYQNMDDVIGLFMDEAIRSSVFHPLPFFPGLLSRLLGVGPKYDTAQKIIGIRAALPHTGDLALASLRQRLGIKPHLVITAFDYDLNRAVYFRTQVVGNKAYEVTLAQAVHAASNAPVNYFNKPAVFSYQQHERRFWDGAVGGNNNPALVGVIEALSNHGVAASDIRVLSIGTGNVVLPVEGITDYPAAADYLIQPKDTPGIKADVLRMTGAILAEPTDAASYMSHIVLGGKAIPGTASSLVRMNPLIQPVLVDGIWKVPVGFNPAYFKQLTQLDMDAVKPAEVALIAYLGEQWLADRVKNQAIRTHRDTLACEIGQETYSLAKHAWLGKHQLDT